MKSKSIAIAVLLCVSIFIQSCAGLSDDAFAHAVKAGNRAETKRLMQPYHSRLEIQERNGRWYNPLQYAIASGDGPAAFTLLKNGAPTSFDGKSLAYNAARVNHRGMANDFVAAGYGTQGDISQAYADASAKREANRRANAASAAMGVIFLAALMGGGGSSSSGSANTVCRNCGANMGIYHSGAYPGYCQTCVASFAGIR